MAHILIIAELTADAVLTAAAAQAVGHTTVTAAHGLPALKQLSEDAFDLIAMDMTIARGSAVGLLRAIRANRLHARTPVLGLLGSSDYDELAAYVNAGLSAAALKPCRMRTLYEAIAEGLGRRSHEGSRGQRAPGS